MKEQCRNYSSTRGLPHTESAIVGRSPLAQALRMCKLYVGSPGRRLCASRPAAGGAAQLWRERRWPSFIIWRWAGPAQVGWTHCPQRELLLLLLLLPRRPRHPSILKSLRRAEARAESAGGVRGLGGVDPGRSQPSGRPRAAAGSRRAKVPRRAPDGRLRSRADRPSAAAAARPGSLRAQAAGSLLDARAPDARLRASGPRRGGAAGGASPAGTGRRRSLSAQCG